MPSNVPHLLTYAPRRPHERRRRWTRRIVILAVAAAVAVPAYKYIPVAWRQAQIWYWQRQCRHHEYPPDTVIYPGAMQMPPEWLRFYSLVGGSTSFATGVIYLHEMRASPGLPPMLVAVELFPLAAFGPGSRLDYRVFSMTGFRGVPTEASLVARLICNQVLILDADKVLAGKADANDPSQFTFDYEKAGQRHTARGRLESGNAVVFDFDVTPPAAPSPASSRPTH